MPATARGEIFLFSFFLFKPFPTCQRAFLFLWGWRGRYPLQPEDLCPDRSFPAWVGAMRLLFGYYEWMKVSHPFAKAADTANSPLPLPGSRFQMCSPESKSSLFVYRFSHYRSIVLWTLSSLRSIFHIIPFAVGVNYRNPYR